MALLSSPSFFNHSPSSIRHRTIGHPKLALHSSVGAVPCRFPFLSATSSPTNPITSVALPSLAYSNVLFFKPGYNVEIIPGEDEPEEELIERFRREVLRQRIPQECKRRRFFESPREKRKRKSREAAQRNRRRRPQSFPLDDAHETPKDEGFDSDEDNWDVNDVKVPYTGPLRSL